MLAVLRPLGQEFHGARVGQLEEEVLGGLEHRLGARQGRVGVDQVGRGVDRTADFAVVAVLVLGVAAWALTLDEAVGQEHVLLGVEELFDGAGLDETGGLEVAVDLLGQRVVGRAVGVAPVVEGDVEAVEIGLAAGGDVGHELLGRLAGLLGGNHDGRAVGIVRPHEVDRMALHSLRTHPGVGLDVFHDVADVEVAVGVRQGGGGENLALGHGSLLVGL